MAGYTTLISEIKDVLKDLNEGNYARSLVVGSEKLAEK